MTMRRSIVILIWLLIAVQHSNAGANDKQIAKGRDLFTHQWIENDPLSGMGDGLGPVYNERSCATCHFQGGLGGSGSNRQNVDILTVEIPTTQDDARRQRFIKGLTALHAGFQSPVGPIPTITLHAHGTNPAYYGRRRELLRRSTAQAEEPSLFRVIEELLGPPADNDVPIRFEHTQRHTPPLFGAGVLDRVSAAVLLRTQKRLQQKFPQVSGRMARVGQRATPGNAGRRERAQRLTANNGRPGRFGWRGQISTLDEFVRGACANELGLAVSTQPQPVDPTGTGAEVTLDLTDTQCRRLTAFVASLPAPKPRWPDDESHRRLAEHGQVVFERIGCNACHVEHLGPAEYVYSDLLLHDMGSGLSDPFPAPSDTTISRTPGYYGGLRTVFSTTPESQTRREWRTPPLWGSADSAPYLHDGRAATFADAILAHGGEAEFCVTNYISAPARDRLALIAFLETLRAPQPAEYETASNRVQQDHLLKLAKTNRK